MSNEKKLSDIGLVGLAVMGENLVMNMANHGFQVSVYNRSTDKVSRFTEGRAKGMSIVGAYSVEELVSQLAKPRKVMLMVKAGDPVDQFIETLIPLLEEGDIIIDGGNSHFPDTERRVKTVEAAGMLYIGTGVSGGEEGALKGPSLMPGGSKAAWEHVKPIFQAIAAKVDDGTPCCDWVGGGGAGHFVKMVHNGIEYGDMQLICEIYQIMRDGLGMSNEEMADTFGRWNEGKLDSYLIEITRDILAYKTEDGEAVVDYVLDAAGQKGTGKWTGVEALEHGNPLTLIVEAVFARSLSSFKELRVEASSILGGPDRKIAVGSVAESVIGGDKESILKNLEQALYASKIISYAQGFSLMHAASDAYDWDLNYGAIALMWRGGCIIRSAFLGDIKAAYDKDADLKDLLFDSFFSKEVLDAGDAWRKVVAGGALAGIPMPAMSAALSYYDGFRCANLPANLLQAQRDYFGAHTYERTDKPRGEVFHTNWTGEGGDTAASLYSV